MDFLEKPVSTDKADADGGERSKALAAGAGESPSPPPGSKQEMVWQSSVMQGVMAKLQRVAVSETVFASTATGTGKELGRALHERSGRKMAVRALKFALPCPPS